MPPKPKLHNFKIAGALEYTGKPLDWDCIYVEPKADGLRMLIIVRKGKARAYSRNGCEVPNAKYICNDIENHPALVRNGVFDGEGICLPDWNKTQSVMGSTKKHVDAKQLTYRIFDFIPIDEWDMQKGKTTLRRRKRMAQRYVKILKSKRIKYVPHRQITRDGDGYYAKAIYTLLKRYKRKGHEGLVLKDPDSVYPFRKSKAWLKLKPKLDIDVKIIGVKWGKKGKTGQMLGLIGSLECEGKTQDGIKVTFHSSGMDMDLRKEMTRLHKKDKLLGHIVEVEYDCITVNNKVRFPRFRRIRWDKM